MTTKTDALEVLAGKVGLMVNDGSSTPWDKMSQWQREANSYRLTLIYQGRRFSFDYWQGVGIKHGPEVLNVLESLLSDAMCSADGFADFCANCGYSEDSRQAEKIYKQCVRQTKRLQKLFGADYDAFINAER